MCSSLEVSWVKQVTQVIWVILGNGSEPGNTGNGGNQVMQVIWVIVGNGSEPGNGGNAGKLGNAGNASNLGTTR